MVLGFDENSSRDFPNGYSKIVLAFSYINTNENKRRRLYGRNYNNHSGAGNHT